MIFIYQIFLLFVKAEYVFIVTITVKTQATVPCSLYFLCTRIKETYSTARQCNHTTTQVGRVLDWLSVASQDVAADADLLRRHSISRILNVAAGIELAPYPGFIYCHAPVLDLPEEPLADVLPRCFEFLDQAVDDGAGVLVHCNAGVSRSVSVVVAYLMSRRRMPFQEALDAVRAVRPAAKPNDGFLRQLKNYRP